MHDPALHCAMLRMMDTPNRDMNDVAENKDLAALSYVWILSLVVFFTKGSSPFAQFHARQGAVLFGLSLVVWAMPFVGKLAEVLILALCILGFVHAAQGEWKELPVIGPLARGSWKDLRGSWRDVVAAIAGLWSRIRDMSSSPSPPPPSSPPPPPPPPPSSSSSSSL